MKLIDLKHQVIVLTVRLQKTGHITVCGVVRYVPATPAVWIDKCCLPPDTAVRPEGEPGHWVVDLVKDTWLTLVRYE